MPHPTVPSPELTTRHISQASFAALFIGFAETFRSVPSGSDQQLESLVAWARERAGDAWDDGGVQYTHVEGGAEGVAEGGVEQRGGEMGSEIRKETGKGKGEARRRMSGEMTAAAVAVKTSKRRKMDTTEAARNGRERKSTSTAGTKELKSRPGKLPTTTIVKTKATGNDGRKKIQPASANPTKQSLTSTSPLDFDPGEIALYINTFPHQRQRRHELWKAGKLLPRARQCVVRELDLEQLILACARVGRVGELAGLEGRVVLERNVRMGRRKKRNGEGGV